MIPLRDDTPCERAPVVTWALIAANGVAFAWQLLVGLDVSTQVGGAIPFELLTFTDVGYRDLVPPPLTIFTSMFLHGSVPHVALNLLTLWIFGNNVEDALGRRRFLAFYVGTGVAAALAQAVATAVEAATLPSGEATAVMTIPMVGASGAIAGVLAAYMTLFPRATVQTLFIIVIVPWIVHLPAVVFIGGWFAIQVGSVFLGVQSGVAFFAHIGGFVAGWLAVRRVGRRPGWHRLPSRWVRPAAGW